jgi:HD superfamily phosphohydrolase
VKVFTSMHLMVKIILRTVVRKILPFCGVFGVGLALWTAAQRNPEYFGEYSKAVQCIGYFLMLIAPVGPFLFLIFWIKAKIEQVKRLETANNRLTEQLSWKDTDKARNAVNRCRDLWQGKDDRESPSNTYEDDPVYLQVLLDRPLAKIVSQPIVQRLNHIKQLSFAYLTFRSATHTRLAHSLGACRNAELVMRKIFQDGKLYSRQGEETIKLNDQEKTRYLRLAMIAALVHDLGHGPLSHALEIHLELRDEDKTGPGGEGKSRVRPDKLLSRKYVHTYLRSVIEEAGVDPDDVIALIKKDIDRFRSRPWMHFISDLIDSPLDVDRMDYLARDSHMTGLSIGALNMQALIERIVPFKEVEPDGTKIELAFDLSAVPYIEQFLYARDVMYLNCYEHPKKIVAERMLGRAFEEFRKGSSDATTFKSEDLALLTDQQIIELMLAYSGPTTLTFRIIESLMKGVTFEILDELPIPVGLTSNKLVEGALDSLPTQIRRWAEAALVEDYKAAYLEIPSDWAKLLSRHTECGIEESQIIVTVPSWSIVDNWQKESEIRILEPDGSGYKVDHVHRISKVLKDFTPILATARLTLRVFVDPDLSKHQKDQLKTEVRNLFTKAKNPSV